jgi:hypothetical protein
VGRIGGENNRSLVGCGENENSKELKEWVFARRGDSVFSDAAMLQRSLSQQH